MAPEDRKDNFPVFGGLATGIGSLPYLEVEPALELVLKRLPHMPFWPQLPKKGVREGMLAQFSENLPCLRLAKEGLVFDPENKDLLLELFYEHLIREDLDYFEISPEYACGLYGFYERLKKIDRDGIRFIKCQVTGPFSFAAGIKDEKGISLLHEPVIFQAIVKGLTMKALWQINLFKEFGKKTVVFIDEPYLACFGSGFTPVTREQVVSALKELAHSIRQEDALVGVHCCGNTDWSIFTEIADIDIINFDAFSFLERFVLYAGELKKFLRQGGAICWGIVPTQEFNPDIHKPHLIKERLDKGFKSLSDKGLDPELIRKSSLISPSCGLGLVDKDISERIFETLNEVSRLIMK